MGNRTNQNTWSGRERLAYIERLAYWRGWVRRTDICARFRISVPQASADISEYIRLNKAALRYDRQSKRYVGLPAMDLKFGEPKMGSGLDLLTQHDSGAAEHVASIDLPLRHVSIAVARKLIQAAFAEESVEIYYFSVHSGTEAWRWISPRAFGHDGYRWHVRAWCHEDTVYKDFVLGRIARVRASNKHLGPLPPDAEWLEFVNVRFRAHRGLSAVQREALERDFAMKEGVAVLRVRKAMLLYTLVYLGLDDLGTAPVKRLEVVGKTKLPVRRQK